MISMFRVPVVVGWLNRDSITRILLLVAAIALPGTFSLGASPDSSSSQSNTVELKESNEANRSAFEQMESDAISFVQQHHPELVSLLQLLKAMKEKEYEVAIRDIDKARKRLDSLQKSDPDRHQIELESWKIQSKIDLLLAKGFAKDKAFNAKSLRGLIKDQVENQKKRLMSEQATLAKRQRQIEEQLEKLKGHESDKVDQQFAALMKRVDAKFDKPAKNKPESKPSDKPKK